MTAHDAVPPLPRPGRRVAGPGHHPAPGRADCRLAAGGLLTADDPMEAAGHLSALTLGQINNRSMMASVPLSEIEAVTSASDADLNVTVRNWRGDTDTWGMEHSNTATCAVRIAADAAMRDPSIRRISGTFVCRGLYDTDNHTSTTTLRGRFDVFTEVWCRGPETQPCRPPPSGTIPGPPDD